jgi:CTP synthase
VERESLVEKIEREKASEEFYTPMPSGYKKGKTKYIIVAGSVMSGVGKGIIASSIAKLLQDAGFTVAPIKVDGYFNQDAGTLNPFRHGEVFVLDDGLECDMDLGSYERYMDLSLRKQNYLTAGMIFSTVLRKERHGDYLGRDVQFIPHVTAEIKMTLRNLAVSDGVDIVVCEIGGTVGDYENSYIIEAIRELMYEEGQENICFIDVSYIIQPQHLGEQKSKAAQLGLNRLMGLGIQPDMIMLRSTVPVSQKIKEKISVYSNVPIEDVIGVHNFDSVYRVPLMLKKFKADERVMDILGITRKADLKKQARETKKWEEFTEKNVAAKKTITIGMAGKYTGLRDSYASVLKALEHAATHNDAKIKIKWIETTDIEKGKVSAKEALKGVDGLVVPGGFGGRGIEGKIKCVQYVREHNIPFLGLCYGFQMATIEFASNVLGLKEANTTEVAPKTSEPVICILPEQEEIEDLGGTMRLGGYDVLVEKNSKAHKLYGKTKIRERFRHRFNVNTKYIDALQKAGLKFSGRAPKKRIMQILELPKHKYFMATQFHPEFTSRPLKPNPLYFNFIKAALS